MTTQTYHLKQTINIKNWKFTLEEIYKPAKIKHELPLPRLKIEKKITANFKFDVNFWLDQLKRLWDLIAKSQRAMYEVKPVLPKKQGRLAFMNKKEYFAFLEFLKKHCKQFGWLFLYICWAIFITQTLDPKSRYKEKFPIRMVKKALHGDFSNMLRVTKIALILTLIRFIIGLSGIASEQSMDRVIYALIALMMLFKHVDIPLFSDIFALDVDKNISAHPDLLFTSDIVKSLRQQKMDQDRIEFKRRVRAQNKSKKIKTKTRK